MRYLAKLVIGVALLGSNAWGFVPFGEDVSQRAWRWDAAPRNIFGTSTERSLDGGLRYSVEGGDLATWYGDFTFTDGTSSSEFASIVASAFSAWEKTDPSSGLTTDVFFVPDFGTSVGFNDPTVGAEIDLFSSDFGNTSRSGFAQVWTEVWLSDVITLTSGKTNHGRNVIVGTQINMNNAPGTTWTADSFLRVLVHEIGHTLGLGDVDIDQDTVNDDNPFNDDGLVSDWYDDNYDGTSAATQIATLSNSFATIIDPFDPEGTSGLTKYLIPVDALDAGSGNEPAILMESNGDGVLFGLANDDYAGRQFLYPSLTIVPEPSGAFLLLCAGFLGMRRQR
ncbi:MAG: hypothetical protein AAGD22_01640 [Verrucomicrobiota bacterium]